MAAKDTNFQSVIVKGPFDDNQFYFRINLTDVDHPRAFRITQIGYTDLGDPGASEIIILKGNLGQSNDELAVMKEAYGSTNVNIEHMCPSFRNNSSVRFYKEGIDGLSPARDTGDFAMTITFFD